MLAKGSACAIGNLEYRKPASSDFRCGGGGGACDGLVFIVGFYARARLN
jgi:hypothetical protein